MTLTTVRNALKSQYLAALSTLQQLVQDCPEVLWENKQYASPFWRIAYHALYYTDLYLEQHLDDFREYKLYRPDYENLGKPIATSKGDASIYTKPEILEFCLHCREKVNKKLDTLDLEQVDSGFHWYKMSKLEHQIVNIRHLQHHAAQLSDRLRNAAGLPTYWVQDASDVMT